MKLVLGLGNPGVQYARTRHNVGFWALDALSARVGIPCTRDKWRSLVGEGRWGGEKLILCKPQTYMNRSGEAVREVLAFYAELDPVQDMILIHDDMDLPAGQLRLRQRGSAGGHNGVQSVIDALGHDRFPRVRIGIGRPAPGRSAVDHVLSPFAPDELEAVEAAAARAAEAVCCALDHSFAQAMNLYNRRA